MVFGDTFIIRAIKKPPQGLFFTSVGATRPVPRLAFSGKESWLNWTLDGLEGSPLLLLRNLQHVLNNSLHQRIVKRIFLEPVDINGHFRDGQRFDNPGFLAFGDMTAISKNTADSDCGK